ncbi:MULTISPECIES: helix-turn-helix transcriptional regulator [Pseudomonas]|uniref:helix-turn-helix transcriptional regulator n=1 Tax=Pseudomonas TaxID=286 RepID=UPI0010C0936F|nr:MULTISPECIES: AlpA family phage regulatory protein [Pseudomonas]
MNAPQTQNAVSPRASRYGQLRDILQILPVGRTTVYEWMKLADDPFPGTISLGGLRSTGRAKVAVWDLEEVYAWLDRQAQKPRACGTRPVQQPA